MCAFALRDAFASIRDAFQGNPTAASSFNPVATSLYYDDFIQNGQSVSVVTGGGAAAYGTAMGAQNVGTLTQTVTAAGVDAHNAAFNGRVDGASNNIFFSGGAAQWDGIGQLPVLSDGVNNIVLRFGMHDGAGVADVVDGAYLEYDFATFGDHRLRLCTSSNSVRTKVDTGVTMTAATAFHWQIFVNAAGTTVTCAINGQTLGISSTTNIPVVTGRGFSCSRLHAIKQLGAGALTAVWDYHSFTFTPSPAR